MYHITHDIYAALALEIERLVGWHEAGMDVSDPHTIRDKAELEFRDVSCTLSFTAVPSYRREEINPGIYGPDGQWGYVRDDIDFDFGALSVQDDDGGELPNDFSASVLLSYIDL